MIFLFPILNKISWVSKTEAKQGGVFFVKQALLFTRTSIMNLMNTVILCQCSSCPYWARMTSYQKLSFMPINWQVDSYMLREQYYIYYKIGGLYAVLLQSQKIVLTIVLHVHVNYIKIATNFMWTQVTVHLDQRKMGIKIQNLISFKGAISLIWYGLNLCFLLYRTLSTECEETTLLALTW